MSRVNHCLSTLALFPLQPARQSVGTPGGAGDQRARARGGLLQGAAQAESTLQTEEQGYQEQRGIAWRRNTRS